MAFLPPPRIGSLRRTPQRSPETSAEMASLPPYQYQPLDLSADSIRLVRLCKGSYDEQINCELLETYVHASEGVPYEALSYTWGGLDRQAFIVVGRNWTLQVTENLYTALLNLRYLHTDRLLWIDAICIDQNNDRERGHQVGQMRKIYQNAEEVLVWLGPGRTAESQLAMKFLGEVNEQVSATDQMWSWRSRQENWRSELNYRRTMFLERLPDTTLAKYRRAFEDLLASPWFRRVWIIQEIACSKKASMLCGRKSVPSRTFAIAPEFLNSAVDDHVQAVLDVMPGFRRSQSWWSHTRTLGMLLRKFRDSEATDIRDKVFALLGMAPDAEAEITPDYEADTRNIVQQTASFLVFGKVVGTEVYEFPLWSLHNLPEKTDEMVEEALHRLMSGKILSTDVWIHVPVRIDASDLLKDWNIHGQYSMGFCQGRGERDLLKLASFVVRDVADTLGMLASTNNLAQNGARPLGSLAVYLAAKYQQWKVVKLLIGYPTAIQKTEMDSLETPGLTRAIWMATWKRHLKMIRLIKYGVDLAAKWEYEELEQADAIDLFNILIAVEGAPDTVLSEFVDTESMMSGWWHIHVREVKIMDLLVAHGAPLDRIWAFPSREHWVSNAQRIAKALSRNGVEIGPVCKALCKASAGEVVKGFDD
ncbi:heterokaryon incompatibility protein-domain-containing protein [Cercophora samala]|uniref:Heterokaryon incompatibility protein-domain-containing protein n=1 Tax=Cercophora samala TaxID=330535 RepID=A0AA39ZFG3_9PEZI|nr:heterokaryon incompatibility protein-domain-containing protein [Cercophora samala]